MKLTELKLFDKQEQGQTLSPKPFLWHQSITTCIFFPQINWEYSSYCLTRILHSSEIIKDLFKKLNLIPQHPLFRIIWESESLRQTFYFGHNLCGMQNLSSQSKEQNPHICIWGVEPCNHQDCQWSFCSYFLTEALFASLLKAPGYWVSSCWLR